ncbi:MAG: GFA family protein [Marinibacterium sp.]|nr:GFA family protein [Marinibacterium sp.]
MTDTLHHQGQCLCGAVTVRVTAALRGMDACHCDACRRSTGGGPFLGMAVPKSAVQFGGQDQIGVYRSSAHAERGFCRICGSALFFRMAGDATSDNLSLCPGLLDGDADLTVVSEMFIDAKPDYYALAGDHPRITGAEAAAKLQDFLRTRRDSAGDRP